MKITKLLLTAGFSIALSLLCTKVSAATFYVDNSLTDTNVNSSTPDCTTYNTQSYTCGSGLEQAYVSIGDINAITLVPGDNILFRSGRTWVGSQLIISGSGTNDEKITISSFGGQTRPILNGNNVAQRNINTNAKNHIVISNLELTNATAFGVFLNGGSSILVDNVVSHNNKIEGIRFASSSSTIQNSEIYDNGGTANHVGIWFAGNVSGTVDNVNIYDTGSGIQRTGLYTFQASGAGNLTIKNSHIYNHPRWGADLMNLNAYQIINNHFEDNGWGATTTSGDFTWRDGNMKIHDGAHNSVIERNIFEGGYGWGVDSYLSTANIYRYNLFINNTDRDVSPVGPGIGLEINSSLGGQVYNNTFYGNTIGLQVTYEDSQGVETSIDLKNNIFFNNQTQDYFKYPSDHSVITTSNNLINTNPQFVDVNNNNFRLLPNSPAINGASNIGLNADLNLTEVPQGNLPDIGAFEFKTSSIPTSLIQFKSDGTTTIPIDSEHNESTILVRFAVNSENDSDLVNAELEIIESNLSFTNTPTHSTNTLALSGGPLNAEILINGLANNKNYKWQIRTANPAGYSNWINSGSGNAVKIKINNPIVISGYTYTEIPEVTDTINTISEESLVQINSPVSYLVNSYPKDYKDAQPEYTNIISDKQNTVDQQSNSVLIIFAILGLSGVSFFAIKKIFLRH